MPAWWNTDTAWAILIASLNLFFIISSEISIQRYRRAPRKYETVAQRNYGLAWMLISYNAVLVVGGVAGCHDLGRRGESTLGPVVMIVSAMFVILHEFVYLRRLRKLQRYFGHGPR